MVSQVEFKFCPFCGEKVKNSSEWVEDGKIFETRWLCDKDCEIGGLTMCVLKKVVSEDVWDEWLEWEWNPYQSTIQKFEN
jgi:hypothetical protein